MPRAASGMGSRSTLGHKYLTRLLSAPHEQNKEPAEIAIPPRVASCSQVPGLGPRACFLCRRTFYFKNTFYNFPFLIAFFFLPLWLTRNVQILEPPAPVLDKWGSRNIRSHDALRESLAQHSKKTIPQSGRDHRCRGTVAGGQYLIIRVVL